MQAFWFKELHVFKAWNRMVWLSLLFPLFMALNPLFLHAGNAMFTAMLDAPAIGLFLAITVDYTTWQDYLDGVPELIVQSGMSFRTYLISKLCLYEAVSTVFLIVSLLAAWYVDRGVPVKPGTVAAELIMACLMNWAWAALDIQLAMFMRLLMPDTAFLLTACVLALPVMACIALWYLLPFVTAALISLIIVAVCAGGAFLLSMRVMRRRYVSTLEQFVDRGSIA